MLKTTLHALRRLGRATWNAIIIPPELNYTAKRVALLALLATGVALNVEMGVLSPPPAAYVSWFAGWIGTFTRKQHPMAAFKNGTRVRKVEVDPRGDRHPIGAQGIVLGSMWTEERGAAYFIEWDDMPLHAVFCVEKKLERV